jgi:hypothetical protein
MRRLSSYVYSVFEFLEIAMSVADLFCWTMLLVGSSSYEL